MEEIKAIPESYKTSKLSPIELKKGLRVETTFECKQVDNENDIKKNIKGKLIVKKKTKDIDDFSQLEKFSKRDIKSNEYIEISLDTDETYKLAKGLYEYYKLFSGKRTNPYEEISYVEKDEMIERIKTLFQQHDNILEVLSNLNIDTLNAALNIENLKRIKNTMKENLSNDGENKFWQGFFEKNAWILSQLFHAPVMFFEGRRYVGGKGIENRGGQITDFIYINDITDNVALIEIKSPVKKIISKEYRQTYTFDSELIGAVNQLLMQKDTFDKNYYTLSCQSDKKFNVSNIEAILVYGNVGELNDKELEVFENYRNELRTVRIIGFDELLKKVENLIDLFSNNL